MHSFRTPGFVLSFSESSAANKIQLFRTGAFHHPEYGEFQITRQLLQELTENFKKGVRGIDIAVDYKHENDDIAAGWIKKLSIEDDGETLWADVDWTPQGKQKISDKEFRYISPEFTFAYKDNEQLIDHGPVLLGAALTNRPVIKYMEPVVDLAEIKTKKQGDVTMTLEEMKKELEALKAKNETLQSEVTSHKTEKEELEKTKVLSEKKTKFQELMKAGKACAAQEEAFLSGDMEKFISLAQPVKLADPKGTGTSGTVTKTTDGDKKEKSVDEEIHALAEEKIKSNQVKTLSEGYQMVMRENKELADKYNNKLRH